MSKSGKGRILVGLVALMIWMCLLPAAMAEPAPTPPPEIIWINGQKIMFSNTSGRPYNSSDSGMGIESGSIDMVSENDTHTLILTDLVAKASVPVDAPYNAYIYTTDFDLTIKLVGNNTIINPSADPTNKGSGIDLSEKALTITADSASDTLTISAYRDCISAYGVVVKGATLNLQPQGEGSKGIVSKNKTAGKVTLQGANVTITGQTNGREAIYALSDILINKSTLTVNGPFEEAVIAAVRASDNNASITVDGESHVDINVTGENDIYGLRAGGGISILGESTVNVVMPSASKKAVYAGEGLKVENSTLEATGGVSGGSTLTITNSNKVTATDTISGGTMEIKNSTVNAEGQDERALDASGDLTILNSTVTATGSGKKSIIRSNGNLKIEESNVTAEPTGAATIAARDASTKPAIEASEDITIQNIYGTNKKVIANGGIKSEQGDILIINAVVEATSTNPDVPAISTSEWMEGTKITIKDEAGKPSSDIIADGGIKVQNGTITVTPAKGIWMQTHAWTQKTAAKPDFESCYQTTESYPAKQELSSYGYVHIYQHAKHIYEITKWDDNNHWKECVCGTKDTARPHTWKLEHDPANHWQQCDCGAQTPKAAHIWNTEHDDTHHWSTCAVCGEQTGREAHSFAPGGDLAQHWQECACGQKKDVQAHNFTQNHGETNHWDECACGVWVNEEPHTFEWTVDLPATETTPGIKHGVCTVCQYRVNNVVIPVISKPPKTGDHAPLALWLWLVLASGAGAALLLKRRRKV